MAVIGLATLGALPNSGAKSVVPGKSNSTKVLNPEMSSELKIVRC